MHRPNWIHHQHLLLHFVKVSIKIANRSTLRWWLKCEASWWIATLNDEQRPNRVQLGSWVSVSKEFAHRFLGCCPPPAAFSSLYLLILLLTFYALIFFYNKLILVKSTLKIYFKNLKTWRPFGRVTFVWPLQIVLTSLHSISMVGCIVHQTKQLRI